MSRKFNSKLVIAIFMGTLLLVLLSIYSIRLYGEYKFDKAYEEVRSNTPLDSCLGLTLRRSNTYFDLGLMSYEDIKNALYNDPGLC